MSAHKQAIIMTAYKNFEYLYPLTERLIQHFDVYIHIDKKSENVTAAMEKLRDMGCCVYSKYSIKWGSYNHLRAVMDLMNMAADKEHTYYHIISGEDIPVRSPQYFKDFFENNNKLYLDFDKSNREHRYRYYYLLKTADQRAPRIKEFNEKMQTLQRRLRIYRKKIGSYSQLYKGLLYASFPQDAFEYALDIINNDKKFMRQLSMTFLSEEFIFPSIFKNSPQFRDRIIDGNLRYCLWEDKHGSNPGYIDQEDIPKIKAGDYIFARKVNYKYSSELISEFFKIYDENK